MRIVIVIGSVLLLFTACDKQRVYEEFTSIPGQTWNSNNALYFNVNIADTTQVRNVLISVRNTGKYEYSNLYLFVTTHSPQGTILRDTVEIVLANERGKWLGKGAASVFTLYHPYKTNIRFPVPGIYTFNVEQAMWVKELKNISDIGLRVENATSAR